MAILRVDTGMKRFKHEHGTRNPIIAQEEQAILLAVERALASSSNSQTIGRNGELPFLKFLQRYLPFTLRAVSGHFITPSGKLSPQLDVIVVDARYPLLAENDDGSALVMLHSVIRIYEIKTNLKIKDMHAALAAAKTVKTLSREVAEFGDIDGFGFPQYVLCAYHSAVRLESLKQVYFADVDVDRVHMDAVILRYHPSDRPGADDALGGELHVEPPFSDDPACRGPLPAGGYPVSRPMHTPLSDLYYSLVQDSYYVLGERRFSFDALGAHFNEYMNWSTAL